MRYVQLGRQYPNLEECTQVGFRDSTTALILNPTTNTMMAQPILQVWTNDGRYNEFAIGSYRRYLDLLILLDTICRECFG